MSRAALHSADAFNPESRNFDLGAVAERLAEERITGDSELDLEFELEGQSRAAQLRRVLSHSRFN